jgi:predicted transcriptional regulator
MAEDLTTVQIDRETDRKLKAIAKAYERSKPAQVRYWANRDYAELERLKLLPAESEPALKPIQE